MGQAMQNQALRRVDDPEQAGVRGTGSAGGEHRNALTKAAESSGDDGPIKISTTIQPPLPSTTPIDESIFPMPMSEGSAPNCRLTRPGSTSVRVIPPLRGLERRYGCIACGKSLFALANVIREDINLQTAVEKTLALQKKRVMTQPVESTLRALERRREHRNGAREARAQSLCV